MKEIAVGWCSVYDSMNESFGEGFVSGKPRIYLPPCNHDEKIYKYTLLRQHKTLVQCRVNRHKTP